jgi:hypothetical protein
LNRASVGQELQLETFLDPLDAIAAHLVDDVPRGQATALREQIVERYPVELREPQEPADGDVRAAVLDHGQE